MPRELQIKFARGGTAMTKKVKTADLFDCKTPYLKDIFKDSQYPWDLLPKIKNCASTIIKQGIPGYKLYAEGVLVGENVKIYPTAIIEPPTIIGRNTEVRPGAFIRGSVIIGEGCVIGNSTELKNAILLDNVQVPHYNYVGDSILGNRAHMGAGAICSNFKGDGSNITVHGDEDIETGLRKFGAILGDNADIGCGSVLNPGTVIGKGTRVYPLTSVRGVIPENMIVKSKETIVEKRL